MNAGQKAVVDAAHLEAELRTLLPALQQKENDQTWNSINDALERFQWLAKNGGPRFRDTFLGCVRKIVPYVQSAISSERSKLSRTAVEFVEILAIGLGKDFEPFADSFISPILRLSTRANRVFVTAATQALKSIAIHCPLPSLISTFTEALSNKNRSMRTCAAETVSVLVEKTPGNVLQEFVEDVEDFVAQAVEDADSAVRDLARACFATYSERFGSRLDLFQSKLSPKAKKYLALQPNNQSKKPSLKEFRTMAMRNRDKSFGETSFLDGFNGAIDAQSEAYGSGAAGKLNLSFSKTAIEPNVAGPSAVPATPALGAGARRKARPSILGAPEDLDDLPMPPGSAIKDVLDRSNSTIANALLHAQRVPKGEGAAKQAPVRRLNLSGAQRVAVPGRLEAKEREKPEPVKIVPPEPISRRSAAYSEPPSSDSITVPDLPRPSKPPVISDRSRSAIPVFHGGDVSSKITTRAAVSDETDIPPVPQKLTISSFKAPLWTSRLAAFETLHRGLEDPAAAEFDFTASKIAEILSIGLDDSHAKVLTAAMQSVKIFVERYPTEPRYLDMYLGRAINLAKATSASSTRQAVAAAGELLEALKLAYDSESVLIASINVLGASDWAKVSRVRIGALDLIQSTLQEQPLLASRTNVMKALVAKLTAFVPEVDQISGRRLRTILTALESKFSPVFFSAVTGLKQNERKLLRSVMLKEVPDWDSKEKQAFAKGQQSAAADTLQKAPSFRREAESVAQALALAPPYPRSPVKADTQETLVPLIGSLSAVDLDEQAKNLFSESAENVAIEPLEDNRDAFIEETALVSAAGGELPPTGGEPVKNLVTLSVVKAQEDDSLLIDAVTEVQPQKETLETMLLLAPEEQQKDPTLDLIAFDVSVVIPAGAFPTGLAPDQTPSSAEHLTKSPRSAKIITPVASPSHGRGHLISPLLKGTPSTQLSPLKIAPLSANSPRFVLEDAVESMMVAEESPQPEAPNTPPPTAVSMPELVFPELAEEPQIEAPNTPPPTAVSMPELGFPDLAEDRKLLPFEAVAPQSETDIHDKPRRLSDIASPVDLDRSLFAPTEMETISEASIERHPADLRSTDAPTESMVPSTAEMLDGHDSSMWSDFSLSPRQNPIERLQRKIARVRQQAKDEIAILEAEVTESRRRFVSELETLRNERDALIEQHEEAMRTALAASAATEASLNAVVESLRSQIGVLETEMAELRSELARIGEQHDAELSATNEKSENRIKELLDEMESLRAATAEGQSMVEAVEQAKDQELAELRAKLAEAEEGFLALRTTASDVDVIVADLRMSIAERDHQIEALQGQVERAETALMTANSALAEESSVRDTKITALETTVQGFEAKEAAFASVVSDLAAAREEIERLRDTLREREASLQAAILERDLQIESLRTQASEADSLKPLLEAGRVELEALRAELHELETRLKDSTAERDRMLEELGEKSAEIDSLRNELAVLGEEVELAREVALSEANLTNADILREREDLEHALTLQTQRADQLEHELGLKTKEIEQLRTAADTGSDAWESKLEAAASAARESHTAAIASLTAEHERHMQELRHEFENRLASISAETKADNGSPSATSLGMKLIELEVDLATMTGDNERLRLQNAQLESEKEVNRAYLERLEERIQSEHQEQQDLAERELVSTRQQVEELRHLLRESELAYENLSRAYNAEIHGVREADDEDEFLDAIESNQLASLDDAIPLLTTDDVSLATFQFLLENSQPDDINGNTLGTLCELAKSNDQNALTLAKTLLLARDSITMDPFIVENNEEPAVDLIVIGAEAINNTATHLVPDLKLCIETLIASLSEAISPQRVGYTVHYILSLELASSMAYILNLFTKLTLLMRDVDAQRIAHRVAAVIVPALQSSDIEVRQIATDSLSLLHSHLGSCLVRELFKELAKGSVINGDLLRFTITKRLNIAGEDVLLAETSIEETY